MGGVSPPEFTVGQGQSFMPSLRFGAFELDLRSGELRKSGTPIKLQPQPFKILTFLAARAGQLVTREEIRREVWGQETFVDFEQGLNYCIRQIRAALGDDAAAPRYIQTCPRRGYRFIAPAEELAPAVGLPEGRVMLAVLPLDNLTGNPEQEYFSDGLTEEMITQLGRLCPERLGIIARTSAMQYKHTNQGIDQIGRQLSVQYVLEGAVRREGNRVRITAQLIRVSDQTHLWAESYERELHDVLLLQSEVASAIAGEIQIKLSPEKRSRVPPGRRVHPEAYEACLKGRYLWYKRTRDDLHRALELFTKAIEKDPEYAPAFAGVADVYLVLLDYRYLAPSETLAQASAAALTALRLDDTLAEAQTSLAHAKLHAFEWPEAEQRFGRAIELNPSYATAHFYYANLLAVLGRFEAAVSEARQVLELDPVSLLAYTNFATIFYHAGDYDHAIEACRKVLAIDANLPRAHDDLGRALLQKGLHTQAIRAFEKATSLSGPNSRYLSSLGHAYAVAGKKSLALRILTELTQLSAQRYVAAYDLAVVNAGLGDKDQAFDWLERALEERSGPLPFLNVDPRLATLRVDPRFAALLSRIGLRPRV